MIVSTLSTINPQSTSLTLFGTVLMESAELVVFGGDLWWYRWPLRSVFALFPDVQLRGLVSWESYSKYFMIDRSFWDLFGVFSFPVLEYWSAVWCSAAVSRFKILHRVVRSASFLAGGVLECSLAHWRSVTVLFKIKSSTMHPLSGVLRVPYVPAPVLIGTR